MKNKNPTDKHWKKLWRNVNMSSISGASGMRTDNNPKLSGRLRKGNQSTKRHEVTITIEDLKEIYKKQSGKCFWLDIPMSLEDLHVSHSPFAPSVDRIDNGRGYHSDNIVLTTRFANKGRGAYMGEDFGPRLKKLLKEATDGR
jgi:hypothetical protein